MKDDIDGDACRDAVTDNTIRDTFSQMWKDTPQKHLLNVVS